MGYLDLLRQMRQQPTFGQFGEFSGAEIKKAQERAKVLQQMGESARTSGDWQAAARLIPEFQAAMETGYGVKPMVAPPVGTPITRQQLGPVPLGAPPLPSVEVGRSFEAPETKKRIRTGLMLQPLEPVKVGSALYDRETGQFTIPPYVETPEDKMKRLEISLRSREEIAKLRSADSRANAAIRSAGRGRAPRYTWVTGPDGKQYRVLDREGLVSEPGFVPVKEYDQGGNVTNVYLMQPTVAQPGRPIQQKKPAIKGLTFEEQSKIDVEAARKTLRDINDPSASLGDRMSGTLPLRIQQLGLSAQYEKNRQEALRRASELKNPAQPAATPGAKKPTIQDLLR